MFNYSKLLGKITEKYRTNEKFAEALGCSPQTLSKKLNNKIPFSQIEIDKSADLLDINIEEIDTYFFTKNVQKFEQK
ncbi:DUF739 family protein [uncultured Anaerofustis sp.]|uniref:DUF739 family protein n=1 Tax=uncultured Anaerofustis sp. TaxID=904996 RepID=UPI0025F37DC3|nr:DUF739 family protein [uncultured Anaerofustis sp.]